MRRFMRSAVCLSLCALLPAFARHVSAQGPLRSAINGGNLPRLADSRVAAQDRTAGPMELTWAELPAVIQGGIVELPLPGTMVKGEVISVRDDGLLVDVRRTSDSKVVARGAATIPRASVSEIRLQKSRGSWGRNLGTTLGVLCGVVGGLWISANVADSAEVGVPLWLGLAGGFTVGGYQFGKAADIRTMVIRVRP